MGLGVLVFMLWEPHLEGRNVHATFFQIYFNDPFLAYVYTVSIAFFTALFQAFRLLGYAGRNQAFSPRSLQALRTIKYCGTILVVCILGAEAYFFIVQRGKDDITGGVMLGLIMIFISAIVATAADVFARTLNSTIKVKN